LIILTTALLATEVATLQHFEVDRRKAVGYPSLPQDLITIGR
jgi:hypothetical protein